MDANELGNQIQDELGQSEQFVGQDEGQTQEETSSTDWEAQAKYHQSEKDKLYAENQKLSQYKEIGEFLESRPDIVQQIAGKADSGQPEAQKPPMIKPDEFDPWEAYNDPTSASYKFRMQEMQQSINSAVNQATQGIRKETGRANLNSQLKAKGLNDEQVQSFFQFADKHPSEYGLDNVIKMWQAVNGAPVREEQESPLDQVRNVQSQPQQAGGILQGEKPQMPKSDADAMWDGIVKAGGRTNVLK
jgi:hypothetical protein|tara:strand:+ start:8452 stop:9189 length:738 start_codon:yes stop_codon:yes gene_type:complete